MENNIKKIAAVALSVSLAMSQQGLTRGEKVYAADIPDDIGKSSADNISGDFASVQVSPEAVRSIPVNISEILGGQEGWPQSDGYVTAELNGVTLCIRCFDGTSKRYTAVDPDGVEIFSADSEGNITYSQALWADYDSTTGLVYAEPEGDLIYSGLSGLVTAALSQEGYWYNRNNSSVDSGVDPVYSSVNILQEIKGRTFELPGAGNVRIEEISGSEDRLPSDAKYACVDESGKVLFYADAEENIIYNLSGIVSTAKENVTGNITDASLLDLISGAVEPAQEEMSGIDHYPLSGEEIRFASGNRVFSLTRQDDSSAESGYICRSDDGGVVFTADNYGDVSYDDVKSEADSILSECRPGDNGEDLSTVNSDMLLESIADLDPVDLSQEEENASALLSSDEGNTDISGLIQLDGEDRPDNLSKLTGDAGLPGNDEFLSLRVAKGGVAKDIVIRRQTDRDFATLDEFGVWRDENGEIAEPNFLRYIGVSSDGELLFTADEDGSISYNDEAGLYYNASEGRFYSDAEESVCLTGLSGLINSSDLAMDGDTVMALLEHADGTSATIEISDDRISRESEGESAKVSEDGKYASETVTEELDGSATTSKYLIWKVTDEDKKYAPDFAQYVCADEEGQVLFYADASGRIYYDVSDNVIYGKKYFFAFSGADGSQEKEEKDKEGKVVVRYTDLGFARYPGAGEVNRFTADGKAFEVSLYDASEGSKGRYICRNVTDKLYSEDGTLISENPDNDKEYMSVTVKDETYGDLLNNDTVVLLMDMNGNICYSVDDFEWQYVDYDLDYALLRRLLEDGESTDDALDEAMIEQEDEDVSEEDMITEDNPDETVEEIPDPEFIEEEPEVPDDDIIVGGMTADDFDTEEEWMEFVLDSDEKDISSTEDSDSKKHKNKDKDSYESDINPEKAMIMYEHALQESLSEDETSSEPVQDIQPEEPYFTE